MKPLHQRIRILEFLKKIGYPVPEYGLPQALLQNYDEKENCIVQLGDKKLRMSLNDAFICHPTKIVIKFINSNSTSYRLIQIGDRGYWFKYTSRDNWKSNQGNFTKELIRVDQSYHFINRPVFSMDFINSDQRYAIDFSTNPGIRGTIIEDLLSQKQIKKLIRDAMDWYGKNGSWEINNP